MKVFTGGRDRALQKLVLTYTYFINFYYGYRYIFRYNSEKTSPTYRNTPPALQNFKYYVAIILFISGLFILFRYKEKIKWGLFETVLCFMAFQALTKSVIISDYIFFIKIFSVAAMAYFVIYIEAIGDFVRQIVFSGKIVLLYHILYSAIQIFLYVICDRLSALAYTNGYVRFGGGWDDPNSFGIYLCIPITYLICILIEEKKSWKRVAGLLICLILELLTLSITSYVGMAVCFLFIIIRYRKKIKAKHVLCCLTVIVTLLIINSSRIYQLIQWKSKSVRLHMTMLLPHLAENGNTVLSFWFGSDKYEHSENFYNMALQNMGVLYWIATIGITIYGIYIAYFVYKQAKRKIDFVGMTFLASYSVAQLGIPFSICVPINYIYWLIYFIVLNKYRDYEKPEG